MVRDTSLHAYHNHVVPILGSRQKEVYEALKKLCYATNAMIARSLKLPINCVTGRTLELRKKCLVVKSHTSWCPVTKNKATYWKLKGGII